MKSLQSYMINEEIMSIEADQRQAVYDLITEIQENEGLQQELTSYGKHKKVLDKFKEMLSYWVKK